MKQVIVLLALLLSTASFSQQIVWGNPIDVAPSNYGNKNPKIVLDASGDPLVSWGDNSANFFSSNASGGSFSTPVEINGAYDALAGNTWGPEITSYGDIVYGIFQQNPPTSGAIWVAKSTDGGLTYAAPVQVDNIGADLSEFVHVTTDDSGNPVAIFNRFDSGWANPRWVLAKSTDGGATFDADVEVSGWSGGGNEPVCECCPAAVKLSGSTFLVAYRDNFSNVRDIWVGISSDSGTSFTSGMNVDQQGWVINSCPTSGPDIEIVGDTIYTTFMSEATGENLIYFSAASISAGTGVSASTVTGVISGLTLQNYPRMSFSNGEGILGWQQTVNGSSQIVMVHSPNINNGFGSSYELVADGNTYSPDFVMNDNEIHAVWRDGTTNTVKYRRGWVSAAGMNEIQSSSAELIKIVDLTGRECEYSPDKPLLFIYSDGTVSRKMIVGE